MRVISSLAAALAAFPVIAEPLPKLGPNAVPITVENAYLRSSPAPDYWAFAPFLRPQFSSSACSVAAVTAAVNGLAGLPANAEDAIPSQEALLERVGDADWGALSAEGGDGVTFAQLVRFAGEAAAASGLEGLAVTSWKPADDGEASRAELAALLAENERSAEDALLFYFNQGVVTGDWDGPHVAVIGAHDAAAGRVPILEVDQEWYIPYWTSEATLLAGMLKPTSSEHGPLAGETGGLVRLRPKPAG